MYTDLAHAVEDLKKKGVPNLSEKFDFEKDIASGTLPEIFKTMKLVESYRFDSGTNPGDESTLYILEQPDETRGYMILGFGAYKDPKKAALIDQLKKLEHD